MGKITVMGRSPTDSCGGSYFLPISLYTWRVSAPVTLRQPGVDRTAQLGRGSMRGGAERCGEGKGHFL